MRKTARVVDADYRIDGDKPVVRLFCESSEGSFVAVDRDIRPYFYALGDDLEEIKKEISGGFEEEDEELPVIDTEIVERTDLNQEIEALKVYTTVPPKIPKLRRQVAQLKEVSDTREFDIPFYKRYLIDNEITPARTLELELSDDEEYDYALEKVRGLVEEELEHSTAAFDLEVIDDEIIMAAFRTDTEEKLFTTADIELGFVETLESEEQLLKRFKEYIKDEDFEIITGYNTDEYDFKRLRERFEKYNLTLDIGRLDERMKFDRRGRFSSARVKGRMHLDLYPFISHVMAPGLESETLDLDSVAEELLGRKKDDVSFEQMKDWWRNQQNLEEFAKYALKDADLAYELAEEIVPQIMELSRITGLIPFDASRLTYGQLTENYLLREAFNRDMISPNRPFRDERQKRRRQGAYSGGFVYSPEPGLYDEIALLDFKSLYPTVMVSHNISPDTLDVEGCEESFELEEFDYEFCQDEQGFFPELIESLIEERTEIKNKLENIENGGKKHKSLDSRQRALKILANSFYGYLGYEGARWYSREAAEATTYLGREYIQDAVKHSEEEGFEVVYGDTDSVFLRKQDLKNEIEGFLENVNAELPSFMELELEGYFKRGFFTSTDSGEGAKKKYALLGEDGSMKITGFEQVRRDWSPIAKETQEKVLRKVLENEPEAAAEIVKETIEELNDGKVDVEKLKIYTTLTKEPEEYGSTAPHVEAVKKARKRGEEIKPETTVAYVITRGGGTISSRAELVKYADSYDAEYYIDNQIIPVSLRALKVFGYTEDQLKGKGKQSGLGRFGG
ncbi:DNA-directed DNA polymerase [Candidatus Nanohalococcus occultus]|uniref:DNA polymerase n=1 Tax=Candidatus Nanohalococcus occultus TaxID=2978047 RepID=A0ABY8CCY8_9ARCH|nr:Archaeal DNA polymerase I [Candidatus Nanohaloarchaeota archaeon SVXNc]